MLSGVPCNQPAMATCVCHIIQGGPQHTAAGACGCTRRWRQVYRVVGTQRCVNTASCWTGCPTSSDSLLHKHVVCANPAFTPEPAKGSSAVSSAVAAAVRHELALHLPSSIAPGCWTCVCTLCRAAGNSQLGWQAVLLGPTVASTCRSSAGSDAAWQGVQPHSNQQPCHSGHVRQAPGDFQHQPVSVVVARLCVLNEHDSMGQRVPGRSLVCVFLCACGITHVGMHNRLHAFCVGSSIDAFNFAYLKVQPSIFHFTCCVLGIHV